MEESKGNVIPYAYVHFEEPDDGRIVKANHAVIILWKLPREKTTVIVPIIPVFWS